MYPIRQILICFVLHLFHTFHFYFLCNNKRLSHDFFEKFNTPVKESQTYKLLKHNKMTKGFEIGEVIDCIFTYYKKPYVLKCEMNLNLKPKQNLKLKPRFHLDSEKTQNEIGHFLLFFDLLCTSKKLTQDVEKELLTCQFRSKSSKKTFIYSTDSESDRNASIVLNLAIVKSWIEEEYCKNLFLFDEIDNDRDIIVLKSPQPTLQQKEAMFFEELMRDGAMKKKILNLKSIRSKLNLIGKF
ncbi:hypothetical protein BpHYR1_036742 [Brachionus plicatilis]|uniref:Uncharacterized protein n=1 Tax=Brachionus plicatilis TaxID=10195 RepID=A0A3M7S0R9_BRAPC|nr:hypothetical protein BpHYR1_036742 [Brachionus plicatilis]